MVDLSPEKGLIFRITHIDNVPWILEHGLHCGNSEIRDPDYREIGNPDLIAKRNRRPVPRPPWGTLSDYVPFYFTPHSPMLLNIKTGYQGTKRTPMAEIAILVSSLRRVAEAGVRFLFTDRHAYLEFAEFCDDLAQLDRIDWQLLRRRDFKRLPDDPGRFERYMAEALVYRSLPVRALSGIACLGKERKEALDAEVERRRLPLPVVVRSDWYF